MAQEEAITLKERGHKNNKSASKVQIFLYMSKKSTNFAAGSCKDQQI